ncbi:glucan endo-1,3-beta-glucosidase-like [Melia azedarach]|uniref:Glucan endo-1,3-beta-glucosidase-like n=1 Tax=Melia azedarach TaxID=155640 RepID=A0ACC1YLM3_MELAZ|nr:glucan endo-1,3-beta-glucosidase-like [Melia azedarach]
MASMIAAASGKPFMASILLVFGLFISHLAVLTGAQSLGVCYGRNGANLPKQAEVISLYKANGIGRMRLYDPDPATLQALRDSNIELILDVPKSSLQPLADPAKARDWVQKNVKAYSPGVKFRYISVGNEIHPSDAEAKFVLPAMQNVQNEISAANLRAQVKVSTAIDTTLLGGSYPPSKGFFGDAASSYIKPILQFLAKNGAPLLVNVYPYFSHANDPARVGLDFALFRAPAVVVSDGKNRYRNLFDAMVDSVYSALEKAGNPNLKIVVSESGWPSAGGKAATRENAGTYYRNLISHVKGGTPKKRGQAVETYLFAMFEENLKEAGVERNFGLFLPNKQPKYQLSFR